MSFGHAAFFSAGAYAMGSLCRDWGSVRLALRLIAAAVVAGCLGAIIGALATTSSRNLFLNDHARVFADVLCFYFLQAPFSGGEEGVTRCSSRIAIWVSRSKNDHVLYYFVLQS